MARLMYELMGGRQEVFHNLSNDKTSGPQWLHAFRRQSVTAPNTTISFALRPWFMGIHHGRAHDLPNPRIEWRARHGDCKLGNVFCTRCPSTTFLAIAICIAQGVLFHTTVYFACLVFHFCTAHVGATWPLLCAWLKF